MKGQERSLIVRLGMKAGEEFTAHKAILIILALATVVFFNSLGNGFVADDSVLVVPIEAYKNFDVVKIFSTMANSVEYLPFRDLTLAIDAGLWGMKPLGFHVTNLFLYLASLIALFTMVKNLADIVGEEEGEFIAFWTTLIFALHPLHTEPLNFITGRNNILAALFLFISFNLLVRGIQRRKNFPIISSLILFVMAVFSKASAIFYPFFIGAVFLFFQKAVISRQKRIIILLAFLAIDAAAVWIHIVNASASAIMNENLIRFGVANPILLIVKALHIPFFYLRMLILPYPISFKYSVSFVSGAYVLRSLLAGIGLTTLLCLAYAVRKKYPLPVLGMAWYFLSLGPVLNLFPTSPVVADRYAYLAVMGFGIVVAYGLKIFVEKRKTFLYAAWAVMAIWSGIDITRNADWHSDLSLWESVVSRNPDSNRADLAEALWDKGRYEEALVQFKEAWERTGDFRYSQYLGKYYFRSGQHEKAIIFYKRALAEGGDAFRDVHLDLAVAYEKEGLGMLALEQYVKTIEARNIDPLGRFEKAAVEGADRIRLRFKPELDELRSRALNEPANFKAQSTLALFLHSMGMYGEAKKFYMKSLELNPASWEAWYNLGLTSIKRRNYGEAIDSLKKSLLINPENKDALNSIGKCYMEMREYRQAEKYFKEALNLDPNFFYAAFNLGRLYFINGNAEKTKEFFSMAKTLAKGNKDSEAMIDQYLRETR